MVNENLKRLIEESKKLKITPKIKDEIKMLHNLGIDICELEYLAYTRIKEETTSNTVS